MNKQLSYIFSSYEFSFAYVCCIHESYKPKCIYFGKKSSQVKKFWLVKLSSANNCVYMAPVRGEPDDKKSRDRTERAQERIKWHPNKGCGTNKKKRTAGLEASQSNCPRDMDAPFCNQPSNLRKNENFNSTEAALYSMIGHLPCAALW